MTRACRRAATLLALAAVAVAGSAGPASAHIQMAPATVAPGDSAKFTVLVPGEREQQTTRVALKVPAGVLPFSYENTPGWTRKLVEASNGAVDQIVWTGRLARDGFVELSFLAGMPERAGTLRWRALQTYTDGAVVRWIGTPDSEYPAPVTRIVEGAAKQNAGGEGPESGAAVAEVPLTSDSAPPASDGDGADWVARGLGVAALVALGLVGLQLRQRGRRGAATA
jgi:uncharacterized protein YcnI